MYIVLPVVIFIYLRYIRVVWQTMRKIKNPNLKDATFLCCQKWSNLVNKKEKCSFCKHLTPMHLKCLKKYKSMRFLSSITSSLHVRHLIPSLYEVIACPIICNQYYKLLLISVIVNNFSVIVVIYDIWYLWVHGPLSIQCFAGQLPDCVGLYLLFDCFCNRILMCRPTEIFLIHFTR